MTRKEEIKQAGNDRNFGKCHVQFLLGAIWADEHPYWINVEDALPEDGTPVLAAFGNHFARVCIICGKSWYLDDPPVAGEVSGVTHWMPLPQPPKEGGVL